MNEFKLYNNATVKLTEDFSNDIKINISCPKLGSGGLVNNTNSQFCKLQTIVDYKWQDVPSRVNWLTVHRSLPFIAYVINTSYSKSSMSSSASAVADPKSQMVRVLNYNNRIMGLCKRPFSNTIVDLAFSYNSAFFENKIFLATLDFSGEVSVFTLSQEPHSSNTGRIGYECSCLLVIQGNPRPSNSLSLAWCPFVGFDDEDESDSDIGNGANIDLSNTLVENRSSARPERHQDDPGIKLAVACDEIVELFSIDTLHSIKQSHDRSELRNLKKGYLNFETGSNIVRISLSNDATAVCCVSQDNSINFLQLDSNRSDFELVHNWWPQLSYGHKISHFHFLDDYNKLLENSSYHFWGFAFIGSQLGELSIWDLKQWTAVQRIQIDVSEFKDPSFSFIYHVDCSSRLITAVYGMNAFVIQLHFDDEDDDDANDDDTNKKRSPRPRMEKITRFQLYNKLISFICKRNPLGSNSQSDELNLFWITQKSLERCIIDTKELCVDEEIENSHNLLITESRLLSEDAPKVNSIKDQSIISNVLVGNLNKNSDNGKLNVKKIETNKSNASLLANLFNDSIVSSSNGNSALKKQHIPPPPTILSDPKQFFVDTPSDHHILNQKQHHNSENNKMYMGDSNTHTSSPTSEEVQKLLKNAANQMMLINHNGESLSDTNEQEREQEECWNRAAVEKLSNNFEHHLNDAIEVIINETRVRQEEILQELAIDQQFGILHGKLAAEIDDIKVKCETDSLKLYEEIQSIRREIKDPSNFKANNKILDNFLRKLMDQLNVNLCKGMSELVGQVRNETQQIVDKLAKLNMQQASQLEEMAQNQNKLENKFKQMANKCDELITQQTNFLTQLKQIRIPNNYYPAASPAMSGNKVLDPNSLFKQHGHDPKNHIKHHYIDEQMQLAETKNKIWKQILSKSGSAISEGFSSALDLKDEQLLTEILKNFADNPQSLVIHFKKDQIVLMSLLNQLTLHALDKHPWKVKFISETVALLDIQSELVQSMLRLFIDKLIKKIRDLQHLDGETHLLCKLLLTILDTYRKQLL